MSGTIVPARVGDDEARVGSDAIQSAEPSAEAAASPGLSVGQQLSSTRLAKGLTANDVAKALKLSLRQVEALEADDWASLPCNTIIRGFVRNYARLLGLNSDQLMAALDRLTMPQGAELEMSVGTPVSIPQEGRVDRRDFVRVLSGLIVLLLAVSAYFFLPQELWLSTLATLKSATQSVEVGQGREVSELGQQAKVAAEPAPVVAPPEPVPAAAAPAAAPAVPAPAATAATVLPDVSATPLPSPATGVLKFSFAQPSWVEVRDRNGQVIFSKKNDAGSAREVEGQPPFSLIIGNSAYVTLQYKGKVVELSKRSKDDVARLTVE
jgi:cytoskeleton protein RodZ